MASRLSLQSSPGSFSKGRTSYGTDLAVLPFLPIYNHKNFFYLTKVQLINFVKFLHVIYINTFFVFYNIPLSLSPPLMLCYYVLCVLSVKVLSVGVLDGVFIVVLSGCRVTWL